MYKYCGPYWSNGTWQESVVGNVEPENNLDECCKEHDMMYALKGNLSKADEEFIACSSKEGVIGSLMAGMVGLNKYFRDTADSENMPPKLRANRKKNNPSKKKNVNNAKTKSTTTGAVANITAQPASLGLSIRNTPSKKIQKPDGNTRLKTRILISRLHVADSLTTPELGFNIMLSPVSFNNTELQQLCRVFEKFRINSFRIIYSPQATSNVSGEIYIISHTDPSVPPLDTGTNFYSRAISGEGNLITSIWQPASANIKVDNGIKLIDNYNCSSLRECYSGRVSVYQSVTTASIVPGFVLADIDISFINLKYNPRDLFSTPYLGPSTVTTTTIQTNGSVGDSVLVSGSWITGAVYRIVLSTTNSTMPTGGTASSLFAIESGVNDTPIVLTGQSVFYGKAVSTNQVVLYASYQACVSYADAEIVRLAVVISSAGSFHNTSIELIRSPSFPSY